MSRYKDIDKKVRKHRLKQRGFNYVAFADDLEKVERLKNNIFERYILLACEHFPVTFEGRSLYLVAFKIMPHHRVH